MTQTDLRPQLRALGLVHLATNFDDVIAAATKKRLTNIQLLEHVARLEHEQRARRGLQRRTKRVRLGRFKSMADFDWNWRRSIDRDAVESALRLDFMSNARNVVLVAAQGLGKTMIAQNIAHQAVLTGHTRALRHRAQMLLDLAAQDSARALGRRLKHYARVGCLVINERGYLSYDSRNADLLYQALSLRYEKKSLVLTTNLAFSSWPSIFPSATSATALIDRVVHHADVINIEGDSYRLRAARGVTRDQGSLGQMIAGPDFGGLPRPATDC